MLWDLKSENTKQLINSWSVAVRHMWDLPYNTHRRFIESLGGFHAETIIHSKYVDFIQSIRKCVKLPVIYLLEKVYNDQTTMTGQNIRFILNKTNYEDIFKIDLKKFKKETKFEELPAEEIWKVKMIKEIVDIKQNIVVLENDKVEEFENVDFTSDELTEIMEYIATC